MSIPIPIAVLGKIHQTQADIRELVMDEVTRQEELRDFRSLRDFVLNELRYPARASHKLESYAWVPTLYDVATKTRYRKDGRPFEITTNLRRAKTEADELSAFYVDVDNDNEDMPPITVDEVKGNLQKHGLPWNHFTYTSFSHSSAKPKFRMVFEIDRYITRSEMLKLFIWVDWAILGQQGDSSIYDAGDCIFAPPFHTETTDHLDGEALKVDQVLGWFDDLRQQHAECWDRYAEVARRKYHSQCPKSPPAKQALGNAAAADMSVRAHVSINNPMIFNPAWLDLYPNTFVQGSHWESMRALLGMIWAKTGGDLTRGELEKLFHDIDDLADAYYVNKYGQEGRDQLLDWLMCLPAADGIEQPDVWKFDLRHLSHPGFPC